MKAEDVTAGETAPLGVRVGESDERYTPGWMLDLAREFHGGPIPLDVCTGPGNPTEALTRYTEREDGLAMGWAHALRIKCDDAAKGLVWCNPPYSRGQVIRWARKAIAEARWGVPVLMLTRADVRTGWFKLLRSNCDQVCLINRSVGFVLADGTQLPGDSVGHALWHFGWRRARFRRVFDPLGWVVDGPGAQERLEAVEVS